MNVSFDEHTSLLVVDVQNDFADPEGSLYVEGGETIVPTINEAIREAREAGALVVYTQDWHPESTPHFEKDGGTWPVHCVKDTWGAQLHPDLVPPGDDRVIRKGTGGEDGYSAFTIRDPETGETDPTDLHEILQARGVKRLVVCGLAQDVCVRASVLDAVEKGYETTVLADATKPVNLNPGDAERAAAEMATAGAEVR